MTARYPGLLSRLAAARCPSCGSGQSVWALINTAWLPRGRRGRYFRRAPFTRCPHCSASLSVGNTRGRQILLFLVAVLPATLAVLFGLVFAAMDLGIPTEGSFVERLPLFVIIGVPFVLLPMILIVRLNGVVRTDDG